MAAPDTLSLQDSTSRCRSLRYRCVCYQEILVPTDSGESSTDYYGTNSTDVDTISGETGSIDRYGNTGSITSPFPLWHGFHDIHTRHRLSLRLHSLCRRIISRRQECLTPESTIQSKSRHASESIHTHSSVYSDAVTPLDEPILPPRPRYLITAEDPLEVPS